MAGRDVIEFDLLGDRELMRKLDKLSDKVGRRVLRKAMRAASTPVVKAVRQRVPVDEGTLKKAIGRKFKCMPCCG